MISLNGRQVKAICLKDANHAERLVSSGSVIHAGNYLRIKVLLGDGTWARFTHTEQLTYTGMTNPSEANRFLPQASACDIEILALIKAGQELKRAALKGGL